MILLMAFVRQYEIKINYFLSYRYIYIYFYFDTYYIYVRNLSNLIVKICYKAQKIVNLSKRFCI
jgi:hypothetical protein